MTNMMLESVYITRHYSGTHYTASANFKGNHGEVKLDLDNELSQRVLDVVAEEIIKAAKVTAEAMTSKLIEQLKTPAIEDNTGKEPDDAELVKGPDDEIPF